MKLINKQYLKDHQYQNSNNLSARRKLFDYRTNPESLWTWVAKHYPIQPNSKILEVGCGSGDFWKEAIKVLPHHCDITLTDFSAGMLENAKKNLTSIYHFKFDIADVEHLSYQNESFDIVMAHLVLYHVDSLERALEEIKRILKKSGIAGILVSGEDNMQPLFTLVNCENPRQAIRFSDEKAMEILPNHFSHIKRYVYEDELKISEVEPLISYIQSFSTMDNTEENFYVHCREKIAHHIKQEHYLKLPITRQLYLVS